MHINMISGVGLLSDKEAIPEVGQIGIKVIDSMDINISIKLANG